MSVKKARALYFFQVARVTECRSSWSRGGAVSSSGPSCTAAPLSTSPHFTECDGPAWKSVKVLCKNTSCVMLKSASRCKMREAAVPLIPFVVLCLLSLSQAARQGQDIRCGACRALVDELEWAISQIDPKKMIQTGSFRINPDGSQSFREVPLARSEGNLLELMETVCERMEDYAEQADSSTNRNSYVRIKSRTTGAMDLSEAVLDSRVTASLKFACETIVEQHEDEIIEFFAHETDNVKDKLCSKRTDLCDHALKMPHDEL